LKNRLRASDKVMCVSELETLTFTDEWKKIAKKVYAKPEISAILKKIGPPFPEPGAHYFYADLTEHIRYAIALVKSCRVDELVTYHLPEIYKRRDQLIDEIAKGKVLLREEELEKLRNELRFLTDTFDEEFTKGLKRCFKK